MIKLIIFPKKVMKVEVFCMKLSMTKNDSKWVIKICKCIGVVQTESRARYKQTKHNYLDDLKYEAFRVTPHKLFQQIMLMI